MGVFLWARYPCNRRSVNVIVGAVVLCNFVPPFVLFVVRGA